VLVPFEEIKAKAGELVFKEYESMRRNKRLFKVKGGRFSMSRNNFLKRLN
jgi:hypothetical protein